METPYVCYDNVEDRTGWQKRDGEEFPRYVLSGWEWRFQRLAKIQFLKRANIANEWGEVATEDVLAMVDEVFKEITEE